MDEVFRHSRDNGVHLGELALSTRQTLFGGSQQPSHGLGSVALDGIAIVIQTAVVEDTKIKLRRSVTAFGGNKEVPDCAALHQGIQTTQPEGIADEPMNSSGALARRLSRRDLGIMRGFFTTVDSREFRHGLK